jgi:hypothetical protein
LQQAEEGIAISSMAYLFLRGHTPGEGINQRRLLVLEQDPAEEGTIDAGEFSDGLLVLPH